ncbi:MAG: hypothetical protein KGS09_21180 [Nitrospirae bacterium]|nr:hypothetical protein [Nitrospirota bacterium]MBU6483039.1 hypothetical protein [Nitrospirota bacterium]MDE3040594.1 hypothetical protein [Nitrospirota bacterium]MDE3050818.1 hypothetical protein [Nitrospirota bacterium]MDE3219147.1 hypothetical protein [Nitrospirota bacterium]
MRPPFFKRKPEDIAGVMFAHVVGFIDGVQFPGIEEQQLNLAELYILGHWLQVACVISAGGGATNRVLKVLESYSEQVLSRSILWLVQSNRMEEASVPAFQSYIREHAQQRREEYDVAVRTRGLMRDVAEIAVHHLMRSTVRAENVAQDVELLDGYLVGLVNVAVPRLKEMF